MDAYEPTLAELTHEETRIRNKAAGWNPYSDIQRKPRKLSETEEDLAVAEALKEAREQVVRIELLVAVRAERKRDKGWLRKALGL